MKFHVQNIFFALLLISALNLQTSIAFAQGTAFTYQGRLNDGANPANGSYDLTFTLFNISSGGSAVGGALTNLATGVSNGLFAVTLDFGNQFPGADRWLEIGVRTNGTGTFSTLSPRQKLTATPYAIFAGNVGSGGLTAGTYGSAVTFNNANNNLSGTFTGNGANVTNVNAATLGGLTTSNFWKTGGNAGTTAGANFLGTTDNQPLEFRVNGQRGLRLEPTAYPDTVNVIGGSAFNSVGAGAIGATIGGGGSGNIFDGVHTNRVDANYGTVSGGLENTIQSGASYATLSGGNLNTIQSGATYSTLGGGYHNSIQTNSLYATLGGGEANTIRNDAFCATIGGGAANTIRNNALYATIPGGYSNSATNYAFAAGNRAQAVTAGTFVWADSQSADFASTAANQFLIRASGGVGINKNNPAGALEVAVASGQSLVFRQDSGLVPGINVATTGGNAGVMRLRNSMEIWPSDDATRAGRLDVRNTGGNANITLDGSSGVVTCVSLNQTSDRNQKENFSHVSPREMLDKVAELTITRWNFKGDAATPHLGPMAQDFHAAFNVGTDEKHIAPIDEGGVALAAIQGLNEKVESGKQKAETQIDELKAENAELKQAVAELKEEVAQLVQTKSK